MNPQKQNQLAHKLVTLNLLLLDNIDELKPRTKEILGYKEALINFAEKLNEEIGDTVGIQKTTYFQDLCNKVDTVIRKNLNIEV